LESPSQLPGFDGPAAVADEVPVRRAGKADVVMVNAEGEIAVVECKRASNPESRRWVIGQVFEYAAGLWKLGYEDFERLLRARGTVDVARWGEESFRRAVSDNLKAGHFRLFIAVDEMTEALKKRLDRTVTLLNSQLPEVQFLAVALPRGGPAEVYGHDPEAIGPLRPKLRPDRSTLIDAISDEISEEISDPDTVHAAEGLLDWAEDNGPNVTVDYSRRRQDGIETAAIETPGGDRLFRIKEQREVRVSLTALRRHWDEERINRFVQDLVKIHPRFQIDTKKKGERPEAPLESLAHESKREEFLGLMEQVLKTLTG
jgi:hypothetical protein